MNNVHINRGQARRQAWQDSRRAARTRAPCGSTRRMTAKAARPPLTRERVVAEALAVISAEGAPALSMRGSPARLGVVPGALYRHVRSKEQLYDLVLDAVLVEVDWPADPVCPRTRRSASSRTGYAVLENHSGIAAPRCKTRDPIALPPWRCRAFLAALHAAGLPGRPAALASRLIYDYTLGFALGAAQPRPLSNAPRHRGQTANSTHSSVPCQPPLPHPGYPRHLRLADDRDQRFSSGLDTLIRGLQAAQRSPESSHAS